MENKLSPLTDPLLLHGEQEVAPTELNGMFNTIATDLNVLNYGLCTAASNIKTFMENVKMRLDGAQKIIVQEQERQQDLNMLCNNYSDFGMVVNMTPDDFTGNFSSDGELFLMDTANDNRVDIKIDSISGNGYEGNKYVYSNNAFQQESVDTSNRAFITDGSTITLYEYSRLTAETTETDVPPEVNFDSIEATCTIILTAKSTFNTVKLISDSKELKLLSIEVSDDGIIYKQVNSETYDLKNRFNKYNVQNYIPDSGIICFPETKYAKLVLQSAGYTLDSIAFYKTVIGE